MKVKKKRVLMLLDDSVELPANLPRGKYSFVRVSSVREALNIIWTDPPDLVVIHDIEEEVDEVLKAVSGIRTGYIPVLLCIDEIGDIDWEKRPVDDFLVLKMGLLDLNLRLDLAFFRVNRIADNNPLTKLPGNTSIIRAIQSAIDSGEGHAVCYLDINNFKAYNDRYGFVRGDDVIVMLSRILCNSVAETAPDGFIGHIGGDDFVFIVQDEVADEVCEKVIADFERLIRLFIDEEDLDKGGFVAKSRSGKIIKFPIPSLSIAVVALKKNKFSHYGEVATTAAQVKSYIKNKLGKGYMRDNREGFVVF